MKMTFRVALLLAFTLPLCAQENSPAVRVAALKGTVQATTDDGGATPLKTGTIVRPGTTIVTRPGAAVDLFLGNEAGTLRLTEKSRLTLLDFQAGPTGMAEDIQLDLLEGNLLGMGNQLPRAARYQVKTGHGIVDVQAKNFRIGSQGFLVVLDGRLVFAHIGNDLKIELLELSAPPAHYYWPGQGVAPAPEPLVREVTAQSNTRLK